MNNLFIINETITNGYKTEALDIISLLAILCAILVIISKNPIISVLYLIGLFGCISSYLILLGLNFIALSYLIVYIGAVSILFLFILMLINIRISEIQNNTKNSIFLGIFITIFLYNSIFPLLPTEITKLNNNNLGFVGKNESISLNNNENLLFVSSSSWDNNLAETNHISSIGNILYSSHNIWLIISSFILLLAMVGTIAITIKNNNT